MKKHGLRWLSLCMAAFMVISMAACGGGEETDTSSGESGQPAASAAGNDEMLGGAESESAEESVFAADPSATVPPGESATEQEGKPEPSRGAPTKTPQAEKLPATKTEILALYTTVMNKAKSGKPGFRKVEYQELTKKDFDSGAVNWILDQAGNYMTSPEKANANPSVNQKGGDMTWFPVYNGSAGCMIAQSDADKAIQSASCTKLDNGNYKLVIKLRPETNPEPLVSYHGKMFSPLSKKDIDAELGKLTLLLRVDHYAVKYRDCTATLICNPKTNQIVSLEQIMYCDITAKGRIKVLFMDIEGGATLRNTLNITNFLY